MSVRHLVRGAAWHLLHFCRRLIPTGYRPDQTTPRFGGSPDLAITWLGHATVCIQLGSSTVLVDPVLAPRVPPVPLLGAKRFAPPAVDVGDLPPVDIVLVTHDHFDHLDLGTCAALARTRAKNATWIAAGGAAEPLVRIVGSDKIQKPLLWRPIPVGDPPEKLTIVSVPSRHTSGRYFVPPGQEPPVGWVLAKGARRVYYAGDTAYGDHFQQIAARLGPFDVALIPIGSYQPRWMMRNVHMTPEEAVQAVRDLAGAPTVIPVHWGTYPLGGEAPGAPIDRLRTAWSKNRFPVEDLKVLAEGETLVL